MAKQTQVFAAGALRRMIRAPVRGGRAQVAAGLLALVLAACAGERSDVSESPSAETGQLPQRVVALAPSLTELVVAIGAVGHLAGRTDYDDHPSVVGLPSIGGGLDPNIEAIVGLEIDMVLVPQTREASTVSNRLAEMGIDALHFSTQMIDDIHESLVVLGEAFAREAAADSLSRAIAESLETVEEAVAGREPVDVFYVIWSDPPMTAGPATFVDQLIQIAGGRNVFADSPIQWPTVSIESIVDRDPDLIVWPQGEMEAGGIERLRSMPGWRDVRAVQEGRVRSIDSNLFNRPGPRVIEAAELLGRLLHPDAFPGGA